MSKLELYESSNELCQSIMNWIVSNRRAFSRIEIENLKRRLMMISRKVGLALGKSQVEDCFEKLIIVNKELNALLSEINSRTLTTGRLEKDIEECLSKFTTLLNDYHYC